MGLSVIVMNIELRDTPVRNEDHDTSFTQRDLRQTRDGVTSERCETRADDSGSQVAILFSQQNQIE